VSRYLDSRRFADLAKECGLEALVERRYLLAGTRLPRNTIRCGGHSVAQRTKRGGAGDVPLIAGLQFGRETVRTIEAVLDVRATHQPDALAFMLERGPVRLELPIGEEVLQFDEARYPPRSARFVARRRECRA